MGKRTCFQEAEGACLGRRDPKAATLLLGLVRIPNWNRDDLLARRMSELQLVGWHSAGTPSFLEAVVVALKNMRSSTSLGATMSSFT